MGENNGDYQARMWNLINDFHSKQRRCEETETDINRLRQAKLIPVEGEVSLLAELKTELAETGKNIDALLRNQDRLATIGNIAIAQIEESLAGAVWDVLDSIAEDLRDKREEQERLVSNFKSQIKEWRNIVSSLGDKIDEALKVRAPVRKSAITFKELQSQIDRIEQDFRDLNYAGVQESLKLLDDNPIKNNGFTTGVDKATADAKPFYRQADLLLLQYPLDSDYQYQYTVLLRTPNQDGSQGINIQDSSTLVAPDREEMSGAIAKVTEAVERGVKQRNVTISVAQPGGGGGGASLVSGYTASPVQTEDVSEMVKGVGDLMYRLFLPEQFRDYLYFEKCSLTITTNDLELPWELMSFAEKAPPYEEKFLCLERPVARMPMGRAFPRKPCAAKPRRSLHFLLVYSDPYSNLPNAWNEVNKIAANLKENWKNRIDVTVLDRQSATGSKMNELLRGNTFDVIHYAGHAYFNGDNADLSGLVLRDEKKPEVRFIAQKIRRLIEGQPLVFLNACQSGRAANERERVIEYLQKPAEGLASAFIYGGAIGCIGSLWPVYDDAAADFAVSFYNHVLEGYMIGDAMRLARIEIKNKYPDQITWAAYVLYGNPTCNL